MTIFQHDYIWDQYRLVAGDCNDILSFSAYMIDLGVSVSFPSAAELATFLTAYGYPDIPIKINQ